MDEGLRTIQLSLNWIVAVQRGCRTLWAWFWGNRVHSESLISTPLNPTQNHLPLNSAKMRHGLGQS